MYNIYSKHRIPPPQRGRIRKFLMIMTLTKLILLITVLQVSATALAQKVTLDEKDAPLTDVFNDINAQTGYDFAFTTTTLKDAKLVTINVKDKELADVLMEILKNQNLDFSIENKSVVIKVKDESFITKFETQIKAKLAQIKISGQVIDETGQPMAGVNIREKGSQNGTTTDGKGFFSLNVTDQDALVAFTFVGYEPKDLAASELPKGVVVTMKTSSTNLHEVVINKGYYYEHQELSTGDVTVVGSKDLESQPVRNPIQELEGKVAGLYIIQNSGVPGSSETVRLRGQNSLRNGNDPLYIIDGVTFPITSLTRSSGGGVLSVGNAQGISPFATLNPDDIESIEVLKDADATAIYGSRGANGVILITTKRGRPGKTKIDLNISQGSAKVGHFMDLMNTQQYLQMRHQAFKNDGLTPDPNADFDVTGAWDTTRYTNWQKALIGGTAHYSNTQLSISGGNENTQFYIGGGYNRQTTVFPGDFSDQASSLRFSLTHSSPDSRFHLQFSAGYSYTDNNLPVTDLTAQALTLAPDAPALYGANGAINWQLIGGSNSWSNPLALESASADAKVKGLTSNLQLSYRIIPGLNIRTSLGYIDNRNDQLNLQPSYDSPPPDNTNPNNRGMYYGNNENVNWIFEPQITYDTKIKKGKLGIVLGNTFEQRTTFGQAYSASGFNSDALLNNPANASTFRFLGQNNTDYRYNATYMRIGYTWDDKYLLNLTGNRDGSSRFGPSKQWGNFGSLGAGWIFSKEQIVKDNFTWLNFGKLKISYGTTGSDQIGDYQYLGTYSSTSSTYQNTTGLHPTRIANAYYSWETDKKLEFGMDLGFLKDRIDASVDYYRNRSGNQLIGYPLPNVSGFITVQANLPAVVQNQGFEFLLNTVNIKTGSFKWSSNINLTIPSNKLISFPGLNSSPYSTTWQVGKSTYSQYVLTYAGVNPADGFYQFKSANGTPTENPNFPADYSFSQPITQKWYGAFNNTFTYKAFQLDVTLQFTKQIGYNYWNFRDPAIGGIFNINMPATLAGNTWQKAGDISTFGGLSTFLNSDSNFDIPGSTFTISDASFIRLRNVQLTYVLPKNWSKTIGIEKGTLFLQGENLATFTHYFGLDPETQSNSLPPLRTIVFGVRASF